MIVQRLANFNRQTVRVRAMSNDSAGPGQTIVFRFPSNTIVDLHNLQLKAQLNSSFTCNLHSHNGNPASGASGGGGGALQAVDTHFYLTTDASTGTPGTPTTECRAELGMPRYTQAMFERVDVTVGGTTITGSNVDYGGLYTLMRDALCSSVSKIPMGDMIEGQNENPDRLSNLLHLFNGTGGTAVNVPPVGSRTFTQHMGGNPYPATVGTTTAAHVTGQTMNAFNADGVTFNTSGEKSEQIVFQGFLGFLGGKFVRFIDTSITGAIEVRIRLNPLCVTYGPQAVYKGRQNLQQGLCSTRIQNRRGAYTLSDMYMILDTISFTDDFYRQLLARRLIEGGSIVIPYDNYFSINKFISGSSDTVTFNVATQSLDYLVGTLRRGDYNANPNSPGVCEAEVTTALESTAAFGASNPNHIVRSPSYNSSYYTFISGAPTGNAPGTTYQWLVANQLMPSWPADVNDVWLLNQSALDIANQISDVGNVETHYEFRRGKFAHITCFCHQAETEKFISGLDTRGASSNMQWMVNTLDVGTDHRNALGYANSDNRARTYAATVWACCTSTIEISAGQNITVIF
jgi:hypothetical protein